MFPLNNLKHEIHINKAVKIISLKLRKNTFSLKYYTSQKYFYPENTVQ